MIVRSARHSERGFTVTAQAIIGSEVIEFWPDMVRHHRRKQAEKLARQGMQAQLPRRLLLKPPLRLLPRNPKAPLLRGYLDDVGTAGPHTLASFGAQVLGQADLDRRQPVIAAAQRETPRRVAWICRRKSGQQGVRCDPIRITPLADVRRQLYGCKRLVNLCEIIIRRQPGAGAVRLPLVLDQAHCRDNVRVGLGIGRSGRITAMLRIVAVCILGPKPMHHEAQVAPAFRAVGVSGAELR